MWSAISQFCEHKTWKYCDYNKKDLYMSVIVLPIK